MQSSVQSSPRMIGIWPVEQRTLKAAIDCVGFGSSGTRKVTLTFRPAPPRSGIVFRRTDVAVVPSGNPASGGSCLALRGEFLLGAERALTALAVRGITNAVVELDSAELPVFDGTSKSFLFLIDCAGSVEQDELSTRPEVPAPDSVRQEDLLNGCTPFHSE